MPATDNRPVAVVTGAARGLGRATALALSRSGYGVVIVARSTRSHAHPLFAGSIEAVRDEIEDAGGEALAVAADLADLGSVDVVVDATTARFGRCDVLVNNAAYSPIGPFAEVSASKWRAALMVNVWAPAALAKAFLPGMIERRTGRIVNVGSSAAVATIPGAAPYCVTKSALERLTAAIQAELATDSGISISCIRIEERIETESNARMAAQGIGGSIDVESPTTAAEFGDAVVWLTRQTQEFGGRTLTLAQLRHVGAIRPRDG